MDIRDLLNPLQEAPAAQNQRRLLKNESAHPYPKTIQHRQTSALDFPIHHSLPTYSATTSNAESHFARNDVSAQCWQYRSTNPSFGYLPAKEEVTDSYEPFLARPPSQALPSPRGFSARQTHVSSNWAPSQSSSVGYPQVPEYSLPSPIPPLPTLPDSTFLKPTLPRMNTTLDHLRVSNPSPVPSWDVRGNNHSNYSPFPGNNISPASSTTSSPFPLHSSSSSFLHSSSSSSPHFFSAKPPQPLARRSSLLSSRIEELSDVFFGPLPLPHPSSCHSDDFERGSISAQSSPSPSFSFSYSSSASSSSSQSPSDFTPSSSPSGPVLSAIASHSSMTSFSSPTYPIPSERYLSRSSVPVPSVDEEFEESRPTGGKGQDQFRCNLDDCSETFSQLAQLRKHQRLNHVTVRPFRCNLVGCGKGFTRSSSLIRHMKLHTGERPHVCEVQGCGKRFSQFTDLKRHIRTHTGEKPYKCVHEGCNKSFSTLTLMRCHERIHTGERPYVCTEEGCGKAFTQLSHLQRHRGTLAHSASTTNSNEC